MKKFLLKIIIFIFIFFFALTFSIAITINFTPIFKFSLKQNNVEQVLVDEGLGQITIDKIYSNFKQLMRYLNNPFVNKLEMNDFPSSDDGTFHFYEVKKLFILDYIILFVTAFFLIFSYFSWFRKKQISLKSFYIPLYITAALPFLGIIFVLFDFSAVFLKFHKVLFSNDKWLFDPVTDPIIHVLTKDFFLYCFIFALIIFEIILLSLAIIGTLSKNKKKAKYSTEQVTY